MRVVGLKVRDVLGALSVMAALGGCTQAPEPVSTGESQHALDGAAAACPAGFNVIQGTDGPDYLVGTPGSDCLIGGAGDDHLSGLGGDDVLLGGPGDDWLFGGKGVDTLDGGDGNDRLLAGGKDLADGGACHDTIIGSPFNRATLRGGEGVDRILSLGFRSDVDGGPDTDACRGDNCELGAFRWCLRDSQCDAGERCVRGVGICAPIAEAPVDDTTCDGVDDDCDGQIDEDCSDTDECAAGTDNCDANAVCTDLPNGFSCTCNAGYAGDGVTCTDVDECSAGTDNCDVNATCTNTPGSFSCACDAGFVGDGVMCSDVDECAADIDNCDVNATCTNTPGSFSCACNAGYSGDGVTCSDVDECADGSAQCGANASCTDTVGGYTCTCDVGFTGDGQTCVDVDECAAGLDNCGSNATCTNTPGSFSCACDPGYSGDGVTCVDVDECTAGVDNCDANASCTNTVGGFSCGCNPGYTGDGVTCADIDECSLGLDNCDPIATCLNTDGTFVCQCPNGSEPDGSCTVSASCLDELGMFPGSADGVYTVDPDGSGPAPRRDVYCDMTTDGGGWQLISVVRSDHVGNIVGSDTCTSLATGASCTGFLAPEALQGGEVLVRDLAAPAWMIYDGFSTGPDSALRYFSGELALDASADCGSTTDNVCLDSSRDPGLSVARTSGFVFDFTPPLEQTWSEGGWAVYGNLGDPSGRVHATAFAGDHDMRARGRRDMASALVGNGAQAILYRPDLCGNGVQDGLESDIDCGGVCGGCDPGMACGVDGDCASGACSFGACGGFVDSCASILAGSPGIATGHYTVDPDGAGPAAAFSTYCDMTTDGGGWQLITVARADAGATLIANNYCDNPRPSVSCKGRMPQEFVVAGTEVLVEAAGTPYYVVFSDFSTGPNGSLRYFSQQRQVINSPSCSAGANYCGQTTFDPLLAVRGSTFALNYTSPLSQWWHLGGWRVEAVPAGGGSRGFISATGYDGFCQIWEVPGGGSASTLLTDAVQRVWFR